MGKDITSHSHSMLWEDEFRQSKTILLATQCYEKQKTGVKPPPITETLILAAFLIV